MKSQGFTLIEILVTLSLISILTVSATMTYWIPLQKTHHASVKMDLLALVSDLENYYAEHQTYKGVNIKEMDFKPFSQDYEFEINSVSDSHYHLLAIPKQQNPNDQCGSFAIDQDGNKSVSGTAPILDCW